MNRYSVWKYVLVVVLVVLGVIYALPSLYGADPAVQVQPNNAAVLSATVKPTVLSALAKQSLSPLSAKQRGQALLFRFKDTTTQLKAMDVIKAVLGSDYAIAPNLAPKTPHWLLAMGAKQMKMGLDLQGGIHFLLAVDANALITQQRLSDMRSVGEALREAHVRYNALNSLGKHGIHIGFQSKDALESADAILGRQFSNYHWKDVSAGTHFSLDGQLTQAAIVASQKYAVEQNMTTLRKRVNELGVSEPVVVQQGATNISVDLPGIQDSARAKELLGKVATIKLYMQDVTHDAVAAAQTGVIPFGTKLYHFEGRPVLLKNRLVLRGSSIVNASAQMGEDGRPNVVIRLGGGGETLFNRVTAENVGKPMATVYIETKAEKHMVDGKVVTTHHQVAKIINIATIQSALGNNFEIMGLESQKYARNLALLLRSGAYTAPLDFVQERLVGPSMGKENIRKGEISSFVGIALIVLFMAIYYGVFGLVADVALLMNVVFVVAILSIIGATLTLPGIAAIVLTVGMAVDANVLINERIREELRNGMSVQAAIAAGYGRAFATIVDANVTTLIVAVVLVSLSSSSVKGFAVNLIIGLLASMVTSIFFTRAGINLIYGHRNAKRISIGIRQDNRDATSRERT